MNPFREETVEMSEIQDSIRARLARFDNLPKGRLQASGIAAAGIACAMTLAMAGNATGETAADIASAMSATLESARTIVDTAAAVRILVDRAAAETGGRLVLSTSVPLAGSLGQDLLDAYAARFQPLAAGDAARVALQSVPEDGRTAQPFAQPVDVSADGRAGGVVAHGLGADRTVSETIAAQFGLMRLPQAAEEVAREDIGRVAIAAHEVGHMVDVVTGIVAPLTQDTSHIRQARETFADTFGLLSAAQLVPDGDTAAFARLVADARAVKAADRLLAGDAGGLEHYTSPALDATAQLLSDPAARAAVAGMGVRETAILAQLIIKEHGPGREVSGALANGPSLDPDSIRSAGDALRAAGFSADLSTRVEAAAKRSLAGLGGYDAPAGGEARLDAEDISRLIETTRANAAQNKWRLDEPAQRPEDSVLRLFKAVEPVMAEIDQKGFEQLRATGIAVKAMGYSPQTEAARWAMIQAQAAACQAAMSGVTPSAVLGNVVCSEALAAVHNRNGGGYANGGVYHGPVQPRGFGGGAPMAGGAIYQQPVEPRGFGGGGGGYPNIRPIPGGGWSR
jgi:hypothetical protein